MAPILAAGMVDHQAAIIQIGAAEIALLVVLVAIVAGFVSVALMHTRMNPYVTDRPELRAGMLAMQTTSTNLMNLARAVGLHDMVQDDLESARILARHLKSALCEIHVLRRGREAGDDDPPGGLPN